VSPLGRVLARQIAAGGPITVADYMAACLTHPEHGYYVGRDPLGKAGDFTTAPEISQMFGELIGLALAQAWMDQGRPDPFTLAELGPGRGTLMADLGRATATVPGFRAAARLWLLEASPVLKARQGKMLPGSAATWIAQIDALPQQPLFLIANEFFDALPVRQFQRGPGGWHERMVTLDAQGALAFARAPAGPVPGPPPPAGVPDGTVIERRAAADPIVTAVAERIARHGGAALIVDYGAWGGIGDTLQAVKDHQPADPLAEPGQADLTAHVDFAALAAAARQAGAAVASLTPQGVFLERLGITERARALARNLTGAARSSHVAAHRRLTHPDEMGTLFQVLGLHAVGTPPPPGCAA
jgi:NADH dehydrogenase [ubiquinone] 1 alpha subcomplex assembly factor 7